MIYKAWVVIDTRTKKLAAAGFPGLVEARLNADAKNRFIGGKNYQPREIKYELQHPNADKNLWTYPENSTPGDGKQG